MENIISATDSNKIHFLLDELNDIILDKSNSMETEIEESNTDIRELEDYIHTMELHEDRNFNLFSPLVKVDDNYKINIVSKISVLKTHYDQCVDEYQNTNMQLKHIRIIKEYIKNLENMKTESGQSFVDKGKIEKNNQDNDEKEFRSDDIGIKLLKTQELERKRISRDLHDSTVQNLTNLIHKTELCSKYADIDIIRTKLELEIMKKTLRTTINDMREIIYDLRPMSLDDLGLSITVERYIEQITRNTEIKFSFSNHVGESYINPIISSTLFRIIQEACNNSVKHAKAENLKISLSNNREHFVLEIEDDGVGFNLKEYSEKVNNCNSNFGLSIMKERVYLLSGQIQILSKIKNGTKITVKIPKNSCLEDRNDD